MNTHLRNSLSFTRWQFYGVLVAWILVTGRAGAQESQPEIRQLIIGSATESKVVGQETHLYGVELNRGQVLRITFQEKGADLSAVWMRVAGEQRASAVTAYGTGFMRESLTLIPDQDGAYVLAVHARQVTNASASYVLNTSLTGAVGQEDVQRAQAERLMEEASQTLVSSNETTVLPAAAKFEESTRIWRSLRDRYWEGISIASLGNAYLKAGDTARAELRSLEALKIFEELKDEPAIAAASVNLGALYVVTRNQAQAKAFMDRALNISRRLGDTRGDNLLGMVNSREAVSEMTTEDTRKYEAEVAAARAKNDKRAEAAVWGRAMLRFGIGGEDISNEDKRPFIERAVREALPLLMVVRDRDIELQLRLGLAIGFYDLTLSSNTDEAQDLLNKTRSMKYLREALVLARVQNNLTMQLIAYNHLNTYYDGDNNRLAIFFGKKTINVLQQFRQDFKLFDKELQQQFTRAVEEGYGSLASDLLFESRLTEAHQVLNFSRDQEFFDFKLTSTEQRAKLTLSPREAANEELLDGASERIAAKYGGNRDADFVSAGEELKITFETFEKNFSVPQSGQDVARNVADTADMQAALRELSAKTGRKHVALYFVEDMTELLLITPEDIKCFMGSAPSAERLSSILAAIEKKQPLDELMKQSSNNAPFVDEDKLILDFLSVLSRPDYDPRPLGAQIYKTIFKSKELVGGKGTDNTLEAELAISRSDVLLWSLRGNLRYVPMGAIYDGDRREYLIEKFQNAVFTRAHKERFLVEPKPWTQGVGFGTSTAYPGFASLPGVLNEVSAIFGDPERGQKGLFSGRVFLNQAFTRQMLLTIQQQRPPLVHIASHFKFQPGDSRNSFLLLGDGNRFSLFDMQQNLALFSGVDLLTLSACETAAQQSGANGKEVDGFAELAQRLGASSVLATLWKVNDNGTSTLMREFYRLRQENSRAAKSEILQHAQLNLLNGKSTGETGRRRRRSRGTEVAETDDEKGRIPFTPAIEAPYEHPYYWAPFVLFGSSR
jgi:CHAT domain-containing protein/tetratricopeptide (TPR) repeat protein